jgi:hypothetical protein
VSAARATSAGIADFMQEESAAEKNDLAVLEQNDRVRSIMD